MAIATIKDIAKVAGVNVSSVSRALNGSSEISPATRKKIEKIALSLGYMPNPAAKALAGKGTGLIGLITPEINSDQFALMTEAIEKMAAARGYSLVVKSTNYNSDDESKAYEYFASIRADGVISVCSSNNYVRPPASLRSVSVCPDADNEGVSLMIGHLLAMGHRAIGFVGDNISAAAKLPAFIRAMSEFRQPYDIFYIRTGGERHEEGGYLRMKELIEADPMPSAVFASSDRVAVGVIKALSDFGLRVPGDVSVAGYGDLPNSRYLPVSLTTVAVHHKQAAESAFCRLLEKISPEALPIPEVSKPELIIRESTSLFRIDDILPIRQYA